MKRILTAFAFVSTVLGIGLMAQDVNQQAPAAQTDPATTQPKSAPAGGVPSPAAGTPAPKIAPGSVIPVQLTKTIDAKKAKSGDEVVAKVTQDMKTQSGEVLLPKDTKVIGHVTEAQARNKEQKESQLAIVFDKAVLNNEQVQMPMSIQAVVVPQNNNQNNGPAEEAAAAPSPGGNSPMSSRNPMPGGQPQSGAAAAGPADDAGAPVSGAKRPPINAQTRGVVGDSNLTLAAASSGTQGSMLTSEKNNVKLESGTMLLLKVNQ